MSESAPYNLNDFYALRPGEAVQLDGSPATLSVIPLGQLRVASGNLEACDPFTNLGEAPSFPIPPGEYPAFVTVADVSEEQDGSHPREAYLSLVIAPGQPQEVVAAISTQGHAAAGTFWSVAVDSGTVAFVDHDSLAGAMPDPQDPLEADYETRASTAWEDVLDDEDHIADGVANLTLPRARNGENIVMSHSGWGDGLYPVLATLDGARNLLAIHLDLLVVGDPEREED